MKDFILTVLTLTFLLLPAVFGVVQRPLLAMRHVALVMLAVVFAIGIWEVRKHLYPGLEPWMGNVFTSTGPLGSIELAGNRGSFQDSVHDVIKRRVSITVVFGLSLLLASAVFWVVQNWRDLLRKTFGFAPRSQGVHPLIPAMLLLVLALFALEMTRWISGVAYDRHLLPFIPFIAIPLLLAYQDNGTRMMPIWSWALLVFFAMIAIAATQEVNSLARARVAAIKKLTDTGILDNQIDAGFEHDYLTELEVDGHINDPRIANPPGAYDEKQGPTPGMRPLYRLESKPTSITQITPFGTVEYFSLLPPFHNTIYIDKFLDPWWVDPTKAATRPVDKSLLPQALFDQYKVK